MGCDPHKQLIIIQVQTKQALLNSKYTVSWNNNEWEIKNYFSRLTK